MRLNLLKMIRHLGFCVALGAAQVSMLAHAENGITSNTILLGQSAVLSGPFSSTSLESQKAANAYFEKINARGGVFGRKIKLVSLDDELKVDKAAENFRKLVNDEQVFALFLGTGTATTNAALPIIERLQVPYVGPQAVGDSVRAKSGALVFYNRAGYAAESEKMIQHLATVGVSRVAVVSLNNPGGKEAVANIEAQLASRNNKPIVPPQLIDANAANIPAIAKEIAQSPAQAVLLFASAAASGEVAKELIANNYSGQIYCFSIASADMIYKAVGDKIRGINFSQVLPYPWDEANGAAKEYQALTKQNNLNISYNSYGGYLSARLMVEALRRAGKQPTRKSFLAGLEKSPFNLGGVKVDFQNGNRTGYSTVDLVILTKEGKFRR
jgi:branched-chain amino acid transport system substrate-binding protein